MRFGKTRASSPAKKVSAAKALAAAVEMMEQRVLMSVSFTPGNLAIFDLASSSSNNTTGSILELSPSTPAQSAPVQPAISILASGPTAMRFSSSGTSSYLSETNDRTLLTFTGYNSTDLVTSDLSVVDPSNPANDRAVATLNSNASFTLQTTYTGATTNQTRSASSTDNTHWFIADKGGLYTNGSGPTSPYAVNIGEVRSFGGTVYIASTTASDAISVASSPTATSVTGLPGIASDGNIVDFYMIKSGNSGSTYDVLYKLDKGTKTISKYSLVSGTWTSNGTSAALPVAGLSLIAANNGAGGAYLYYTTGTTVVRLTDSAGYNASINTGSATTLYTATGTNGDVYLKSLEFVPVVGGHQSQGEVRIIIGRRHPLQIDRHTRGIRTRCSACFRAVIVATGGRDQQAATLTVVPPAAPTLIYNPADQSVQAGGLAVFTANAAGSPAPSIQWQISTNNGSTWTSLTDSSTISGSTTNTLIYTTNANGSENGALFRAEFGNGIPTVSSKVDSTSAKLTVLAAETLLTNWDFSGLTGTNNSPAPLATGAPGAGVVNTGTATIIGMDLAPSADPAATFTGSVAAGDFTSGASALVSNFSENVWRVRGISPPPAGGTANGWSNLAAPGTQGVQFSVPTTGYSSVYVVMDWFSTKSAELDAQRQYTLDGTHWINLGPQIQNRTPVNDDFYGASLTGHVTPVVFDLTGVSGANNNANFGIRLVNAYNVLLSQVQTIELADANSFTLNAGAGQTTGTIAGSSDSTVSGLNAEAALIQSALASLSSIGAGNVTVSGYRADDGNPAFTVTFGTNLQTIVPTLISSDSFVQNNGFITHVQQYANAQWSGLHDMPAAYNGSKGNWRFDNIQFRGSLPATAPTLASSQVADGTAQRSTVNSVRVVFNAPVNFTAASFTLNYQTVANNQAVQNSGGSLSPTYTALSSLNDVTFSTPDSGITWILSAKLGGAVDRTAGAGDAGGLGIFADGIYTLSLHGSSITDAATSSAAFNSGADQVVQFADGTGTQHGGFSALFGDIAGTANVTANDNKAFSKAFLKSVGDTGYNAAFCYSGTNASITANDNKKFAKNFLISLVLP